MSNNSIQIRINGETYELFQYIMVEPAPMDAISGRFQFGTTTSSSAQWPIKRGDSCQILVNNQVVITGFIEAIDITYNSNSHHISFSGRDSTNDIIDSTLPGDVTLSSDNTLEQVIEQALLALNLSDSIGIINNVDDLDPFDENEIVSSETTHNAFDFINDHALARQVLLSNDGGGNIVIQRAGDESISQGIINKSDAGDANNVKSASLSYDDTKRYNTYVCRSQQSINYSSENLIENFEVLTNTNESATDAQIRNSRRLEFFSERSLDAESALKRSIWEANIRKSRALAYSVRVQDFTYDGLNIWQSNVLCPVVDEFSDLNTQLLINSVRFVFDVNSGSYCELSMTDPDSYKLETERPVSQQRSLILGEDYAPNQ